MNRSDRPAPILVEQATRNLPDGRSRLRLGEAPPVCVQGAAFVDEMFFDRRISSVEWFALRDAIWPLVRDPSAVERSGAFIPLFRLAEQPTNPSAKQGQ